MVDPLSCPATGTTINEEPLVHVIESVLTPDECQTIIDVAKPHMKRAVVSSGKGGVESPGRSGANHWVKHNTSPEIHSIVERISEIVGMPLSHAESLQVIYYSETQQYRPHFDAYDLDSESGKRCTANGGQRLITALIYLNDVEKGGGTVFPKIEQTVDAKQGRMVVFHNCHKETNTRHPHSVHGGLPVDSGEKWACNLWFRENARNT